MKLAVTATRQGLSVNQLKAFDEFLSTNTITEFIHGDCIGGDETLHKVFVKHYRDSSLPLPMIVLHPCNIKSQRAHCIDYTVEHGEQPPLVRNQNIVNACDMLLVFPFEDTEELRSGTWATYRYAKRIGKPYQIVKR